MVEKKKSKGKENPFEKGIRANELLTIPSKKPALGEKETEKKKQIPLSKLRSAYVILVDAELPDQEDPEDERKQLITAMRKALK